ncbi:hypothetical protein CO057_01055 [Candidatus Uhrbacteria bacterium CG_4_9_14_0_2_um_filter_41_50]|uniref:Uncharacterized protein n=1 Tax=Candidatus Uhrbacteria bacterium CG_4_9_14_0_2_um_filter_41_50 TaxID=1975031 RepID=A0A2M8EPR9_9BACT|nr:MAG: hypothetical protein COZ45_02820 [Candidatus Uhrbacteria bacterium CG_4_10_14_3_um_filter_41_21]PIZ54314.1 MAG: hypothetical protein COY24_04320 [Candidatus Uhrbacteria bacterium CG_4_10_14_0_2_um_filter_41_21]PJB85069.1 MAG: hypothetical protein CO086_00380 [Candidatus Uhrbacteria bacterium CG_4_9_14_0_8_um_filter_41_16]PJC24745.1 MAG: hypothetical protein CO057_01055 [Candidatus Uhrbacteria bacterium CG_4_9_14_0_2_um_filter_41_50]PJE75346.1 MAG: hypothetical protein COV03_00475 [Candi
MKSKFLIIFFTLLISFGSFGFVQAETCECFCKSTAGAVLQGSSFSDSNTCRETCGVGNYLGCYTEAQKSSKPDSNSLCYSQYECENDTTEIDGVEVASEWGGQESVCLSGEGYCYSAGQSVALAVSILNPSDSTAPITEIDSLPEYINVAYNFLIPAGSLLAIVMIMIGGLQYMLARGDSGKLSNAKTRIQNAAVGMVLLLCAVTIAQFIDPSFTELGRLQPPKVRTVTFIDPNSSCETLEIIGMTVVVESGGTKECGFKGTVTDLGDQTDTTFSVGDTCEYHGCEDTKEQCVRSASEESGYACASCSQWDAAGLDASASNCHNLEHVPEGDEDKNNIYYCEYWETGYLDLSFDQCVELVYPGGNFSVEDYLDCDVLGSDYDYSCRGYDEVWSFALSLDDELLNELDDIDGTNDDFPLLQTVCKEDPCGFAPPGEKCEVWIPSQMEGAVDACDVGLGPLIPYCEDVMTEIERTDCINSGYIRNLEEKIKEGQSGGDPSSVPDPVCRDKAGDEIDCMITI